MPDQDILVARLRAAWPAGVAHTEVKMFGGLAFLHRGNMVVAASGRGLLLRVGTAQEGEVLALAGTSLMEMRGKPVPGYIRVGPEAVTDALIAATLPLALAFVETLPPKAPDARKTRTRAPPRP